MPYINTNIHTCMDAYIRKYRDTYLCVCVPKYVILSVLDILQLRIEKSISAPNSLFPIPPLKAHTSESYVITVSNTLLRCPFFVSLLIFFCPIVSSSKVKVIQLELLHFLIKKNTNTCVNVCRAYK